MTTKSQAQTKNANKFFPQSIITETQSLLFTKRLFALAISNILWARKIFPENAFSTKSWDGNDFFLLNERSDHAPSKKFINWIRIIFDPLERRYLKKVAFILYPADKTVEHVVECYLFSFFYNPEDESVNMNLTQHSCDESVHFMDTSSSSNSWKTDVRSLLENLKMCQDSLEPLPKNLLLTVKIDFNDQTPSNFALPGFAPKSSDLKFSFASKEQLNIRMGNVSTKHHSLHVVIRSDCGLRKECVREPAVVVDSAHLVEALDINREKEEDVDMDADVSDANETSSPVRRHLRRKAKDDLDQSPVNSRGSKRGNLSVVPSEAHTPVSVNFDEDSRPY